MATSADQQHLPLSRRRPKLIGKARPATNGNRTSTKYQAKVTEQPAKVNLCKHSKNALEVSVFWHLAGYITNQLLRTLPAIAKEANPEPTSFIFDAPRPERALSETTLGPQHQKTQKTQKCQEIGNK